MNFIYVTEHPQWEEPDELDLLVTRLVTAKRGDSLSVIVGNTKREPSSSPLTAIANVKQIVVAVAESQPRRLAWEATQAAAEEGALGIVCRGWTVSLSLSGNPTWKGKLILVLSEQEAITLLEQKPVQTVRRIIASCAVVLAPRSIHKRLVDSGVIPAGLLVDLDGQVAGVVSGNWEGLLGAVDSPWRTLFMLNSAGSTTFTLDNAQYVAQGNSPFVPSKREMLWRESLTGGTIVAYVGKSYEWHLLIDLWAGTPESTGIPTVTAWHLRRFSEYWPVSLVLVNDPKFAAYSLGHKDLCSFTCWVGTPAQIRMWLDDNNSSIQEIRDRARQVAVRSHHDRHDLELTCPDMQGRVHVLGDDLFEESSSQSIFPVRYGTHLSGRDRRSTSIKVLIVSHDFKFCSHLIDVLAARSDIELRLDRWCTQHKGSLSQSRLFVQWADVIWVDFASGAAEWYSHNLRANQRLVVRVHGYELEGSWANGIDFKKVARTVFVSEHARSAGQAKWGLTENRTSLIPNTVDRAQLLRPKTRGNQYALGMLGWTPSLKRIDRAVELLERLLSHDDRYRLYIKGAVPNQSSWILQDEKEVLRYSAVFEQLRSDSSLAKHIVFEDAGADVAHWFQRVGWILSPSERESFHLAPVEGMASGAVPIIWERAGASDIFPEDLIVSSVESAVDLVHETSSVTAFSELASRAQAWALRYDREMIEPLWMDALGLVR